MVTTLESAGKLDDDQLKVVLRAGDIANNDILKSLKIEPTQCESSPENESTGMFMCKR